MIGLMVSAWRFVTDPTGWLLERWRVDRLGGERHEFYRQALVDAESEEDVFEGEFWCNEHDTFCDHKPPYCTGCGSTHAAEQTCLRWAQSGIPASGADASPPVVSGVAPPRISPTGGPQLEDLIAEVLGEHIPNPCFDNRRYVNCGCRPGYSQDLITWRAHVALRIADALQAQ